MTYNTGDKPDPFGRPWSQSQFRALLLLHELGHQLDNITHFVPDKNLSVNQLQTYRIMAVCF